MVKLDVNLLEREIKHIKDVFARAAFDGRVTDVSFIGNASEIYPWEPTPIVDLDICLFVSQRDRRVGLWLSEVRQSLAESMNAKGLDFDLRIIRGPYKQALMSVERPIIIVHMS